MRLPLCALCALSRPEIRFPRLRIFALVVVNPLPSRGLPPLPPSVSIGVHLWFPLSFASSASSAANPSPLPRRPAPPHPRHPCNSPRFRLRSPPTHESSRISTNPLLCIRVHSWTILAAVRPAEARQFAIHRFTRFTQAFPAGPMESVSICVHLWIACSSPASSRLAWSCGVPPPSHSCPFVSIRGSPSPLLLFVLNPLRLSVSA